MYTHAITALCCVLARHYCGEDAEVFLRVALWGMRGRSALSVVPVSAVSQPGGGSYRIVHVHGAKSPAYNIVIRNGILSSRGW